MGIVTIYPQGLLQWFIEIPSHRVLQSTSSLSPWREEFVSCAHSFSRETDRQSDSEEEEEEGETDSTSSKLFLTGQTAGIYR